MFVFLTVQSQKIERLRKYNYLETVIIETNDSSEEIRVEWKKLVLHLLK